MTGPINILFDLDRASPGIMNRKPRKIIELIINTRKFAWSFITGLFMASMALFLFQIGKTNNSSFQFGQIMALVSLSMSMMQKGQ